MAELKNFEQKAREVEARIHQNRKDAAEWDTVRQKLMTACVLLTVVFALLTAAVWVLK